MALLSHSWNVAVGGVSGAGDDGSVSFVLKARYLLQSSLLFPIKMLNAIDHTCSTPRVN
jgi:hypothetical protein